MSYDWLVVAGSKAQFKGTGTINGAGNYGFLLIAIDGTPDRFRMKIWDKATDYVISTTCSAWLMMAIQLQYWAEGQSSFINREEKSSIHKYPPEFHEMLEVYFIGQKPSLLLTRNWILDHATTKQMSTRGGGFGRIVALKQLMLAGGCLC